MADNGDKRKEGGLTRREIIASGTGVVGLLALGAVARSGSAAPLVRPPGGQDETEFLARCLRCDRCRSVCPRDAVGVAGWAEGLVNLRTPVMNFHLGDCDFCGKCAEVCPTGALRPFHKDFVRIGVAEVTTSCIALRTGACRKCYEACPYDAITLDARNRPIIDPDRCNGCGTCVLTCPANVFQSLQGGGQRGIEIRPRDKGDDKEGKR